MVRVAERGGSCRAATAVIADACDVSCVDRSASRTSPNPAHALRELGGCEDTPILTPGGATALLSQSPSSIPRGDCGDQWA